MNRACPRRGCVDQIAEEAEVLLVRTNGPDPDEHFGCGRDDIGLVHADLCRAEDPPGRKPFRTLDVKGVGPAHRRSAWPRAAKARQGRNTGAPEVELRRTRGRPRQHRLLPQGGQGLWLVLAVPRPDRPAAAAAQAALAVRRRQSGGTSEESAPFVISLFHTSGAGLGMHLRDADRSPPRECRVRGVERRDRSGKGPS